MANDGITYGELLELSNRFANLLQELAAATGSRSTHGSSKGFEVSQVDRTHYGDARPIA